MPVRLRSAPAASSKTMSSPDPSLPRGKGGCWTCRLRRKKCDEQRENDSCQTCRRLKIECLGWGVKRPDWMRDKAQVDAYKARIKNQLSNQGMIRGQRKLPNASPSQYPYSEPSYTNNHANNDSPSDEAEDYNIYSHSASATTSPAYHTVQIPQATPDLSHGLSALDLHLFPTPGAPLAPLPNTFPTSSPHIIPSELSMMHFHRPYYDSISAMPSQPVSPTAPQTPSRKPNLSLQNREQYILYFFNQIRQIHFLYSGPNVESVLRDLVVREPNGVVASSICAVAALHQSIIGADDSSVDNTTQNSISKQFHEHTWWLLQQSHQRMGRYTEQDATAAIHLVTYSLLSDGSGEWQVPLTVALEWLTETPLNTFQNPRLQWLQQSLSARFTAQMTMWFDIIAAINTGRAPRFIDLYRRLFFTDQSNSPLRHYNSQQLSSSPPANFPIQLSQTRCPDGVMYALAETAWLSQWKDTQIKNGCLSYRELVKKAEDIENELKTRCGWAVNRATGAEVTLGIGMALGVYLPDQLGQHSSHLNSSLYSHSQHQGSSQSSHSSQQQSQRQRLHQQNYYQSQHGPSTPSSQSQQFDLPMGPSLSTIGLGLAPLSMGLGMGHGVTSNLVGGTSSSTTYPTPSPTLHSSMDLTGSLSVTTPISPTSTAEQMMVISNVFYEAALVYLWSTVSGHFPAIPEIADLTQSLVNSLHELERLDTFAAHAGRELLFPICLAGCLSETREHRDFFTNCVTDVLGSTSYTQGLQLGGLGHAADVIKIENGNSPEQQRNRNGLNNAMKGRSKILDLMEEVWRRRDESSHIVKDGAIEVDWRRVREELCGHLLVI